MVFNIKLDKLAEKTREFQTRKLEGKKSRKLERKRKAIKLQKEIWRK